MNEHLCPWWLGYTFDNRLRRLFHNPQKILGTYIQPGATVADIGCGMGFFSIGMARIVGENGKVIAADLQKKMLDILMKRAARAGVANRITPH
jgi:ubiquinone/menaquinone biosynthesis C-methylase UbiE